MTECGGSHWLGRISGPGLASQGYRSSDQDLAGALLPGGCPVHSRCWGPSGPAVQASLCTQWPEQGPSRETAWENRYPHSAHSWAKGGCGTGGGKWLAGPAVRAFSGLWWQRGNCCEEEMASMLAPHLCPRNLSCAHIPARNLSCGPPTRWQLSTFPTDDNSGSLPTRCQADPLSVSIGSVDHSTTPSSAQAFLLMVPWESKCWVGFVQGKCLTRCTHWPVSTRLVSSESRAPPASPNYPSTCNETDQSNSYVGIYLVPVSGLRLSVLMEAHPKDTVIHLPSLRGLAYWGRAVTWPWY